MFRMPDLRIVERKEVLFRLQVRHSARRNEMRRRRDSNRQLAETPAAKSAPRRLLELVPRSFGRRTQFIDGLLERTLAEQAEFDEEPRLPSGLVSKTCTVIF